MLQLGHAPLPVLAGPVEMGVRAVEVATEVGEVEALVLGEAAGVAGFLLLVS